MSIHKVSYIARLHGHIQSSYQMNNVKHQDSEKKNYYSFIYSSKQRTMTYSFSNETKLNHTQKVTQNLQQKSDMNRKKPDRLAFFFALDAKKNNKFFRRKFSNSHDLKINKDKINVKNKVERCMCLLVLYVRV